MSDIIKIDHLCKNFGDVKAVRDLSFRVKEGELVPVNPPQSTSCAVNYQRMAAT